MQEAPTHHSLCIAKKVGRGWAHRPAACVLLHAACVLLLLLGCFHTVIGIVGYKTKTFFQAVEHL